MLSVESAREFVAPTYEPQGSLFEEAAPIPERDNPFVPDPIAISSTWDSEEMARLAEGFLEKTELLVDVLAPPNYVYDQDPLERAYWKDFLEFEVEEEPYVPERENLSLAEKAAILRVVWNHDLAGDQSDEAALDYLGMTLLYRQWLLSPQLAVEDKREILKRIYTSEEHWWTTDEIVLLHFILIDECSEIARPDANNENRIDILKWMFTDPWLEDGPFSFKNAIAVYGGSRPGLGKFHERILSSVGSLVPKWRRAAIEKKEQVLAKRAQRTGQGDLFLPAS